MVIQHQKNQRKTKKIDIKETVKVGKNQEIKKDQKIILEHFTNHEKKLSKVLIIILKLYLKLNTKHVKIYEEGLKVLICKQMLQKLPIALAQVKSGTTTENLLHELTMFLVKKLIKTYKIV